MDINFGGRHDGLWRRYLIPMNFINNLGTLAVGKFRSGVKNKSFFIFKQGAKKAFPGTFMKTMTKREAMLILQL